MFYTFSSLFQWSTSSSSGSSLDIWVCFSKQWKIMGLSYLVALIFCLSSFCSVVFFFPFISYSPENGDVQKNILLLHQWNFLDIFLLYKPLKGISNVFLFLVLFHFIFVYFCFFWMSFLEFLTPTYYIGSMATGSRNTAQGYSQWYIFLHLAIIRVLVLKYKYENLWNILAICIFACYLILLL